VNLEINLGFNGLLFLRLFRIAAWLVLDIDAFVVVIFDVCLRPFVLVELLLELLFVHNCPARPIAICHLILAFIGVVPVFEASLAADNS